MAVTLPKEAPVHPTDDETLEAKRIDAVLETDHPYGPKTPRRRAQLIAPTGESFDLPQAIYEAIHRAIHLLARGNAVAIVPYNKMLTTQQAADLLNVSRPYLVNLVEKGEIRFERVGSHRRIRFEDLMEYRTKRDAMRRSTLKRLTRMHQKLGLYKKR